MSQAGVEPNIQGARRGFSSGAARPDAPLAELTIGGFGRAARSGG
jgi:hypothetical protein